MSDVVPAQDFGTPAQRRARDVRRSPWLAWGAFSVVMAVAAFGLYGIHRELTESALARRSAVADLAAATLAEKFDRILDVAASLASRVRFRELIEAGRWEEAAYILRDAPRDFPLLERVTLHDAQGVVVAGAPALPAAKELAPAHRDWFKDVQQRERRTISPLLQREGAPPGSVFVAAVPIRSEAGRSLGVLAVQVRAEGFFGWLRGIDAGESALTYVVDPAGTLAAHPGVDLTGGPVGFASVPAVQRVLRGERGVMVAENPVERQERVSAFSPVERHGWGVVVAEPVAGVFATRNALLAFAVAAYALTLGFFGAYLSLRVAQQRQRADRDRELARAALQRHQERLRVLHEIDRAIVTGRPVEAIATVVIQPLRTLLDVPRAIVNLIDLRREEAEWLVAAGRQRTHVGSGVRFPLRFLGDAAALQRGEPQVIDTLTLPEGEHRAGLLASGVRLYMAVPMIAGGELIGAVSFGGERGEFPPEQVAIATEVATQLAIAITQTRLREQVLGQAAELERRVQERTEQLNAANRELEDLYDNAPCAYHSVDAEGRIVRINGTWLQWLGYERDQVIGRMHSDLMTPESARRFRDEVFPRFRREGRLDNVEFDYMRRDGSIMHGSLSATVLSDAAGNYVASRSTVFDVTDRKRYRLALQAANAGLEAANKELESFSYSVSHDLRSPLRAVDGYARMLEEDYAGTLDEEGRRLLGVVRAEASRMGRLIDDLLAFARTGRQALQRSPVDMAALVRECAEELCPAYPKARLEVGALPATEGDRAMLKQVWANLIANALKYSGKQARPRVEVGGGAGEDEHEYWVRDNGAGFDERYAGKLFGVFQRLHGADEFPGTGVGLAIVQRVVARHGGRVRASGKPGAGATFTFTLPATRGD